MKCERESVGDSLSGRGRGLPVAARGQFRLASPVVLRSLAACRPPAASFSPRLATLRLYSNNTLWSRHISLPFWLIRPLSTVPAIYGHRHLGGVSGLALFCLCSYLSLRPLSPRRRHLSPHCRSPLFSHQFSACAQTATASPSGHSRFHQPNTNQKIPALDSLMTETTYSS